MDVTVDARLMRAGHVTSDGDPAMHPIELSVEGSAAGVQRLDMAAPAVDELMRSGSDPLVVVHVSNIRHTSRAGKKLLALQHKHGGDGRCRVQSVARGRDEFEVVNGQLRSVRGFETRQDAFSRSMCVAG